MIAFYAPMKPPDHPTPSGDREIARLFLRALETGGHAARTVSTLRTFDKAGDRALQADLMARAGEEADWLVESLAPSPPDLWLTYHCYYKAPDLVGPPVTAALGIPYVIAEPSISPRRRAGPWAGFAAASEAAIAHADRLLWATMRDRPALEEAGFGAKLRSLPPFLDPGDAIQPRPAGRPLRLLTIAMMRPGDKIDSYRRIAAALGHLSEWELTVIGGGEGESAVQALFEPHRPHVAFLGTLTDPRAVRAHAERADVFVWPGVGEGVGMVWLEAQAAGLPVVAEEGPAARALIGAGRLTPPGDAPAFARAIGEVAAQREQLSFRARAHVEAGHGLAAAARTLSSILEEVA